MGKLLAGALKATLTLVIFSIPSLGNLKAKIRTASSVIRFVRAEGIVIEWERQSTDVCPPWAQIDVQP